tara:strand:- start:1202 stop:1315 length:114 start_codon:yes stop_codon:yes gene_type:complete
MVVAVLADISLQFQVSQAGVALLPLLLQSSQLVLHIQ